MKLSIVVPLYNEFESVRLLHEQINNAIGPVPNLEWEVIYVDDGSVDSSPDILEKLTQEDPQHTRAVILRRNFGQTAAIAAGIDQAQGEIIVLIDADLQNDPADIPLMVEKIDQGYDVVSGWRENRQDAWQYRSSC